ncbi:hypothetical protein C5167_001311 [Papaver somniferum]|uniref:Uncharacterized protein n=1 Tax=Papaver somniferum TaxID=3469 RepID=A0A4Y7KUV7_PAPSO|nr:hypothetical protein C5167_001311 [Papaver somniferum]
MEFSSLQDIHIVISTTSQFCFHQEIHISILVERQCLVSTLWLGQWQEIFVQVAKKRAKVILGYGLNRLLQLTFSRDCY